jgi:hypothetical protein
MEDKIIVTHRAALTAKYGTQGVKKIAAALKALIAADKARGLNARVIYLDDAQAMKALHAAALASNKDIRGAKTAIDGVYKALKPDYLMILGAPDVIPHQDLTNPAYKAGKDDDNPAWGDVPYACDEPYGRDPAKFVGPTRVVGRLPDLTGATEPSHILALLKTAAGWKGRKASAYSDYFGLSTDTWKVSTGLSLDSLLGSHTGLLISPTKGPNFTAGQLGRLTHFINCHGDTGVPEFYGEKGDDQPISLKTASLKAKIGNGTVSSVECCYGAELYNSIVLGIDIPICQSYLRQGSYGYFGSTTIAYGPADENGAADLICQYFIRFILEGASIGRAVLMARQEYVKVVQQMDPIDLKTLAQFCIYGDPSIHPVLKAEAPKAGAARTVEAERFRRSERRAKLKQTGDFLQATKPTAAKPEAKLRIAPKEKKVLANIAAEGGLKRSEPFVAYKVKGAPPPPRVGKQKRKKAATAPYRYLLAIGKPAAKKTRKKTSAKRPERKIAIIVKEVQGRIVDYRIYERR